MNRFSLGSMTDDEWRWIWSPVEPRPAELRLLTLWQWLSHWQKHKNECWLCSIAIEWNVQHLLLYRFPLWLLNAYFICNFTIFRHFSLDDAHCQKWEQNGWNPPLNSVNRINNALCPLYRMFECLHCFRTTVWVCQCVHDGANRRHLIFTKMTVTPTTTHF